MSNSPRIVIVGGVAGGASAAARARRLSEDAEIILFERGDHTSFANCGLPYHIGGTIADRNDLLVQTKAGMEERFNIHIHTRTEVRHIDREHKQVTVHNLDSDQSRTVAYDKLILSPGAEPVRIPIPGIQDSRVHTLRNLADMDAIIERLGDEQVKHAVVVGGGYIGLEMAEALRHNAVDVTLVELADQVFLAADREMVTPVHQEIRKHGVDLRLETSIQGFRDRNGRLEAEVSTGNRIPCDLALLAIGVRPESDLAADAGLETGKLGGISVNEHMQTSDPAIYAVGDAVEVRHLISEDSALIPLAGPANRQGRIAADHIMGRVAEYKDTQGTAICKIFDLSAAVTGLNERQLKQSGWEYEKIYTHPSDHAGYYPGSELISMKLLFCPDSGKIYGAQAVGAAGVDKRIDVLATAIRAGMTIKDLEHLELCYAPPYGSAKDPVNYIGFVAHNVIRGDMKICHAEDIVEPDAGRLLLDVRTPEEATEGTIPDSVNIPIDDLRSRLPEIPRDKEILVFCAVGIRGYLAVRILEQHGFSARNLSGGYTTYRSFFPEPPQAKPRKEISSKI